MKINNKLLLIAKKIIKSSSKNENHKLIDFNNKVKNIIEKY